MHVELMLILESIASITQNPFKVKNQNVKILLQNIKLIHFKFKQDMPSYCTRMR